MPNSSSTACIDQAGTYTVEISSGGKSVNSLSIGGAGSGTRTLKIDATMALELLSRPPSPKGGSFEAEIDGSAVKIHWVTGTQIFMRSGSP